MIVSLVYTLYFYRNIKSSRIHNCFKYRKYLYFGSFNDSDFMYILFKEKIPLKQLFVYILGIVSTCIVVFDADINLFLSLQINKGDIIFVIASFCMALYPIFIKFCIHKDDPLVLAFTTIFGGIIWMILTMEILCTCFNPRAPRGKTRPHSAGR